MARGIIAPMGVASVVRRQHVATKSIAIRNRQIRQVVAILTAVAIIALGYVWVRVRVIQLGYEVTRLHREVRDLREARVKLRTDIARLKSPDRLERVAAERFGMRLPHGDEIIFVDADPPGTHDARRTTHDE